MNKTIYNTITKLSSIILKQFDYYVHAIHIVNLLYQLEQSSKLWDLVKKTDFSIPVLIFALEYLIENDIIAYSRDKYRLKITMPSKSFKHQYYKYKIKQVPIYSQLNLSYKSSTDRGKYILENAIPKSDLCIIGDDDFLSLSLAKTSFFNKIVVINIDRRIINQINRIAKEDGLKVKGIVMDLNNQSLSNLENNFDLVVSDPPYEVHYFKLFLNTSVKLLKDDRFLSQIFLSFTPENIIIDVEKQCQDIVNELGLLIYRKECMVSHNIPYYLTEKYATVDEINKKIISRDSDLDKWLLLALGRREYLFHLFLCKNNLF